MQKRIFLTVTIVIVIFAVVFGLKLYLDQNTPENAIRRNVIQRGSVIEGLFMRLKDGGFDPRYGQQFAKNGYFIDPFGILKNTWGDIYFYSVQKNHTGTWYVSDSGYGP